MKRDRRLFTSEEDAYLLAHAETLTLSEMAREMGRPFASVQKRTASLGLSAIRKMAPTWTETEDAYLLEHFAAQEASEIASHLGRDRWAVYHRLAKLKKTGVETPKKPSASADARSWVWLAGVFDSSGHVRKRLRQRDGITSLDAALVITADAALLAEVLAITGLGTIRPRSTGSSSDWIVYKHAEITQVGKLLLPHLRIKREALEQLLSLISLPPAARSHHPQAAG